jgi:ribosomal protein S27E
MASSFVFTLCFVVCFFQIDREQNKGANYQQKKKSQKNLKAFFFLPIYEQPVKKPIRLISFAQKKKACLHERLLKTTDEFTFFPNWKFKVNSYDCRVFFVVFSRISEIYCERCSKTLHKLDVN